MTNYMPETHSEVARRSQDQSTWHHLGPCRRLGVTVTRTCSQCMHLRIVNHSPIDRCSVRGEFMWANTPACPSFNAPTGLRWVPTYSSVLVGSKDGPVVIDSWKLTDVESDDDEHDCEGRVLETSGRWEARLTLMWGSRLVASGTLHDCARALVDAVKGAQ